MVLSQCPARVYPEDALVFVHPLVSFLFYCAVLICFVVPQAYVQVCTATAIEDQLLVLSLGIQLHGSILCWRCPCGVLDT